MNPIAIILVLTGVYLFIRGISLFRKSRKVIGAAFAVIGLIAIATPFLVSYFLAR
jgi:hypothetical protein